MYNSINTGTEIPGPELYLKKHNITFLNTKVKITFILKNSSSTNTKYI